MIIYRVTKQSSSRHDTIYSLVLETLSFMEGSSMGAIIGVCHEIKRLAVGESKFKGRPNPRTGQQTLCNPVSPQT